MTKTEIKRKAQDELMLAMQTAFTAINDDYDLTDDEKELVEEEASKQMERIEKLLGYVPQSWQRGC